MENKDFESVIPTAIFTAYPLTLTDIPYSKEVFEQLNKDGIPENLITDKHAVELEARRKLISSLLKQTNISQILELASGYSTRGLGLAENNDQIGYVELDLPEVIKKKIPILNSFSVIPSNLHLISGNALSADDFNVCAGYFEKDSQVAVINEGLLRYLSFEEKKKVAENVRDLLSEFGGKWITCDVTPSKFIINQNANMPNYNENLSSISHRNNPAWRFKDIDHVREFFGEIGFVVESVHPFSEIKDELTSPAKLGLGSQEVDDLLADAIVAVMQLK